MIGRDSGSFDASLLPFRESSWVFLPSSLLFFCSSARPVPRGASDPGLSLFSLVAGLRYLKTNFGSPGWMGNEASSVQIHSALTAEDLKVTPS